MKQLVIFCLVLLLILSSAQAIKTFHAQETDFVKIRIQATDPDKDQIIYHYSAPLNERGEWHTGYSDAGEYFVNITASDGKSQTVQVIRLVVREKNRPPVLTARRISVKESQTANIKDLIVDPDGDLLTFIFSQPLSSDGSWKTGFDNEGRYLVTFTASDGQDTTEGKVEIVVHHTNQQPEITKDFAEEESVSVREGEKLNFFVEAEDRDGDKLRYTWLLDGIIISKKNKGSQTFNFESEGSHELAVIVSDGAAEAKQQWVLEVKHGNRAPSFKLLPITVQEGDRVAFDLPQTDQDGDNVTYSAGAPFNATLEWKTDYDDAGVHAIEVTASDGESQSQAKAVITILETDQPPLLNLPESITLKEGELLSWAVPRSDPDGDNITLTMPNVPEGASFDGNVLQWTPSFDLLKRRFGIMSTILNGLRLEQYMLGQKEFPLSVTACGKQLCTAKETKIVVYNSNRPPVVTPIADVNLTETQQLKIHAAAEDPDGDVIRYSYSSPLDKNKGSWKTDYNDAGEYEVNITASDGFAASSTPVKIQVEQQNRPPTIEVADEVTALEGKEVTIPVKASDPDNESLMLWVEYLPRGASFNNNVFRWTPPFDTVVNKSGQVVVWLPFTVFDDQLKTVHPVKVIVKDVNQKPEMVQFGPKDDAVLAANEPAVFYVAVDDKDGDNVTYSWNFGLGDDTIKGVNAVQRTFVTPGEKKVKVVVSDGREEVEKIWKVKVLEEEVMEEIIEEEPPMTVKVFVVEG
ncbi:PKD domain-containing protein [Candidatus Woesearchaeota archaeon]|nr:PKD domain-containing protein [Candidatus Woesearchaeota archaeon]